MYSMSISIGELSFDLIDRRTTSSENVASSIEFFMTFHWFEVYGISRISGTGMRFDWKSKCEKYSVAMVSVQALTQKLPESVSRKTTPAAPHSDLPMASMVRTLMEEREGTGGRAQLKVSLGGVKAGFI